MSLYFYILIYVTAVCLVVVAVFFPNPRLRAVAVVVGALALWMPFTIYKTSLGQPHPFAEPGDYELLGIRWNPEATRVFVLVNNDVRTPVPRLYSMSWEKHSSRDDDTFDMNQSRHGYVGSSIHLGPASMEVLDAPFQLPDLDKDKWYAENNTPLPIREALVEPK